MRAVTGRWFLLVHRLMTLAGLGAMIWHVICQSQPRVPILIILGTSCGMWVAFAAYRLHFGCRVLAEVVSVSSDASLMQVEVVLRKPVKVEPGKYFNITFPGILDPYISLHRHLAVAFCHPPEELHPCRKVPSVSFLLSRRGLHAAKLAGLGKGDQVLLEGPFGKNLKLEKLENIILAAKGIGIAGVLPLALELAERKRHDDRIKTKINSVSQRLDQWQQENAIISPENRERLLEQRSELVKKNSALLKGPLFRDATKKVDIFWLLDDRTQMHLVQDHLRTLQKLDPEEVGHRAVSIKTR
jgi:hypothetical protein